MMTLMSLAALLSTPALAQDGSYEAYDSYAAPYEEAGSEADDLSNDALELDPIYRIDGEFIYSYSVDSDTLDNEIFRIDGDFVYSMADGEDGGIYRIDGEFVYGM